MSTTTNVHLSIQNPIIKSQFQVYTAPSEFTTISIACADNTITYFFQDKVQLLDFTKSLADIVEKSIKYLSNTETPENSEESPF